jgi:DNA-binding transcriptional MerR regulator
MKTGKVAKALAIDRKTVSNWTDLPQLKKYFTPSALGVDRTQRDYTELDVLIINTIRVLRNDNASWEEIADALEHNRLERELPPSAMMVETTLPIAQFGRMVELQTALEGAYRQNGELREQVQQLQTELSNKDAVHREEIRDVIREAREQEGRLQREIGKLEAMLEMARQQNHSD